MTVQSPAFERRHEGMLAIQVGSAERMAFLRKVYSLFSLAMGVFAATAWWATENETALRLVAPIAGGGFLGMLLFMGLAFFMLRVAAGRFPLNLIALVAFAAFEGLFTGVLITSVIATREAFGPGDGLEIVTQAAVLTGVVFAGLTLFTLTSKKDFSFLRAGLWTCFWVLIGMALIGWLFGFDLYGWGMSLGWVLLMAGFLIYDTSNIMRHYPVTAAVPAAIAIFLDVVIMFKHLLMLLSRRD
jgi:modulator of FtsH protease